MHSCPQEGDLGKSRRDDREGREVKSDQSAMQIVLLPQDACEYYMLQTHSNFKQKAGPQEVGVKKTWYESGKGKPRF